MVADSRYPHLVVWAIGEARRRRATSTPDPASPEAPAADTADDAVSSVLEAEASH